MLGAIVTVQQKKLLNLGCGYDKKAGYLNVDVDQRVDPDLLHDLMQPLPFKTEAVDGILLQDVLEHFTKEDGVVLIKECERMLKKGGKLTVRVPNVSSIFNKYSNQEDLLFLFLYGDTSKNGVWGAHKYGYTPRTFQDVLAKTKLLLVAHQEVDTNLIFSCKKVEKPKIKNKTYSRMTVVTNAANFTQGTCTTTLSMLLVTPQLLLQKKKVIWDLQSIPPTLIAKLLLRPLSKKVDVIKVKNKEQEKFCRVVLKYSHLRLVRL